MLFAVTQTGLNDMFGTYLMWSELINGVHSFINYGMTLILAGQ